MPASASPQGLRRNPAIGWPRQGVALPSIGASGSPPDQMMLAEVGEFLQVGKHMKLTRRQILASLGGLPWLSLPPLQGAPSVPGSLEFLVVSDTHLGYKDQDAAEQQWIRTAAALEASTGAFVLHLGDVVDGGREEQYPRYLAGRKAITKPVLEIPGNHDPVDLFQRHLRQQVDTVHVQDWLRVILLNNARRDSHAGFLTPEQVLWIRSECGKAVANGQWVILAMHVPLHANKHPDRGWFVAPDQGQTALYECLAEHSGRILALFHGHFHNGLRGWDDHPPMHEIVFPSALYNQDRKLEDQHAPGWNPPAFHPGFTRVKIDDEGIHLSYQPVGSGETVSKSLA